MNDSLYYTQINEIEGEIASLKMTINRTLDKKRREKLAEEVKELEEQKKDLEKRQNKKNNSMDFKEKYKVETNNSEKKYTDEYFGPTGPNEYPGHEDI